MSKYQVTENTAPYWSELQKELQIYIRQCKKIEGEKERLKGEVNAFCLQGTGFQLTIYKFIKYECHVHVNESKRKGNKKIYEEFVDDISFICQYLDKHYLQKHPKNKKTIHSIHDITELYRKNL